MPQYDYPSVGFCSPQLFMPKIPPNKVTPSSIHYKSTTHIIINNSTFAIFGKLSWYFILMTAYCLLEILAELTRVEWEQSDTHLYHHHKMVGTACSQREYYILGLYLTESGGRQYFWKLGRRFEGVNEIRTPLTWEWNKAISDGRW